MRLIFYLLFGVSFFFVLGCGGNSEKESSISKTPWVGTWQMVGYDNVSVADRDTLVIMKIDEQKSFQFITRTRNGEILTQNEGEYSINDQNSVITVSENGQAQVEYFIRKVDKDSFIFESDTFSIKWKRID